MIEIPNIECEKNEANTCSSYYEIIIKIILDNFLLVCFLIAVLFAMTVPVAGVVISSLKVVDTSVIVFLNNFLVFLVSGVTLKIEEMTEIWENKYYALSGLIAINFVTTLLAFGLRDLPFPTNDYAIGFTIFATVPTTLGVGVALTLVSKGDVVLSLFLTITSNMLGILTVPYLLAWYTSNITNSSFKVNPSSLAIHLVFTCLIPTIIGILLRKFIKSVALFTKTYKQELSMFTSINLAMIVWMALSNSYKLLVKQDVVEIILVIITAIIMHIIYLIFNWICCYYILDPPLKQTISLVIMCSQKSSPVALSIISNLTYTDKGLFVLPCLFGQISQIFIGTFLAKQFSIMVDKDEILKNLSLYAETPLEITDDREHSLELNRHNNSYHSASNNCIETHLEVIDDIDHWEL